MRPPGVLPVIRGIDKRDKQDVLVIVADLLSIGYGCYGGFAS